MKQAIFEVQKAKALKKWHKVVKDKKKLRKGGVDSSWGFMSGENTPSPGTSPIHLLHKHQSNKSDFEADLYSPKSYQSDTDLSEIEGSTPDRHASRTEGLPTRTEESHNIDFAFVKAWKKTQILINCCFLDLLLNQQVSTIQQCWPFHSYLNCCNCWQKINKEKRYHRIIVYFLYIVSTREEAWIYRPHSWLFIEANVLD